MNTLQTIEVEGCASTIKIEEHGHVYEIFECTNGKFFLMHQNEAVFIGDQLAYFENWEAKNGDITALNEYEKKIFSIHMRTGGIVFY